MKKKIYAVTGIFIALIMAGCTGNNAGKMVSVEDDSEEWSRELLTTGTLTADLNKDGVEDIVRMETAEMEGSTYITRFEVILSGIESGFLISETYDASFEKMKMVDIDRDTDEELLILFNSHGAGGQGTHDLYVLWLREDGIAARKTDTVDAVSVSIEPDWNVDGIYDIEKVEHNGEKKLLVRQYMWSDDGHANRVGDLVSVVSYDSESGLLKAEEAWIEQ